MQILYSFFIKNQKYQKNIKLFKKEKVNMLP